MFYLETMVWVDTQRQKNKLRLLTGEKTESVAEDKILLEIRYNKEE